MAWRWIQTVTHVRLRTETFDIINPSWEPQVTDLHGRFVAASNATLLGCTSDGDQVIYKPTAGVRPLWDFPAHTLPHREVWAYRIAKALAVESVPETVMADGPYGPGAVQRFIESRADDQVVAMINQLDEQLEPIALLDVILNNADRKVGHILQDKEDKLWAIDHGLTFHEEDKLRTVLWGFSGRRFASRLIEGAERLAGLLDDSMGAGLAEDLGESALEATQRRVAGVVATGTHPPPPLDRPPTPWPLY